MEVEGSSLATVPLWWIGGRAWVFFSFFFFWPTRGKADFPAGDPGRPRRIFILMRKKLPTTQTRSPDGGSELLTVWHFNHYTKHWHINISALIRFWVGPRDALGVAYYGGRMSIFRKYKKNLKIMTAEHILTGATGSKQLVVLCHVVMVRFTAFGQRLLFLRRGYEVKNAQISRYLNNG